jgi:hypothetical protein
MATNLYTLASQNWWEADGTSEVWPITFAGGYIDRAHVKAWKRATLQDLPTAIPVTDDMFVGDFQLKISPPVPDGWIVAIYRDTPKTEPLVNFQDGSNFSEASLDTNAQQAVFIAAETQDLVTLSVFDTAGISQGAINTAAQSAAAAAVTPAINALRTDIADATAPAKGAGMVGFNNAIAYPLGSVGAAVRQLIATGGGSGGGSTTTGVNGISITAAPYNADNTGTAAVDAAAAAAFAAVPDGGVLVFPAGGTYKLGTLEVTGKNVTICAEGANIICTSTAGGIFKKDHTTNLIIQGGRWFGQAGALLINYNCATPPSGAARFPLRVYDASFESTNNWCVNLVEVRETAFTRCEFTTTSTTSTSFAGGVYARNANNPYFVQCIFAGQQKGYGALIDGNGNPRSCNPIFMACEFLGWKDNLVIEGVDDFHVTGCTIDYGVSSNLVINACDNGRIQGGYIGGGIDGTSSNPALEFNSKPASGWDLTVNRCITVSDVSFTNHQFTGNNMDMLRISGSAGHYSGLIVISGCHFFGYTRYGISFATDKQLTILGNTFVPYSGSEPAISPIYNQLGTGDSLVLIAFNQFPNPTSLSGANLQSAQLFNNGGYSSTTGAASMISQANGFTGIGGFGSAYWHWVDAKGPVQLDRYANPPTYRARRAAGTRTTPTAVASGDVVLGMIGSAYGTAAFQDAGAVQVVADGLMSDTNSPGRVRLLTTRAGTVNSLTSGLELDSNGDVFVNPVAAGSNGSAGALLFHGTTRAGATLGVYYLSAGGSPEAVLTAKPGSICLSSSGSLWIKGTGTGNTGWGQATSSASSSMALEVTTSSTTIANGGAFTKITFSTVVRDTASAWANNTFTAPATGTYQVNGQIAITASGASAVNEQVRLEIYKNGVRFRSGPNFVVQNTGAGINGAVMVSAQVYLTVGETMELYAFCNTSGGNPSANGTSFSNWLSISRG